MNQATQLMEALRADELVLNRAGFEGGVTMNGAIWQLVVSKLGRDGRMHRTTFDSAFDFEIWLAAVTGSGQASDAHPRHSSSTT